MTQWRSPGRDLLAGGAGCPVAYQRWARWKLEAAASESNRTCAHLDIWISAAVKVDAQRRAARARKLTCHCWSAMIAQGGLMHTRIDLPLGARFPFAGTPPSC